MSGDRILVNHGAIETVRQSVNRRIDLLRTRQNMLKNANDSVLGPWEGKAGAAFEILAEENDIFFRAMNQEWQNLSNALGVSNQEYETRDNTLAGQYRGN